MLATRRLEPKNHAQPLEQEESLHEHVAQCGQQRCGCRPRSDQWRDEAHCGNGTVRCVADRVRPVDEPTEAWAPRLPSLNTVCA